jgi:virginiamycin A acetyltransferase
MKPLPTLISLAPVEMTLSTEGSIARETYLFGEIDVGHGAVVERGTQLIGDVTISRNAKVGEDSRLSGDVTVGRYSRLGGGNFASGNVSIGQFCAIAECTGFLAKNHEMSSWAMQRGFKKEHGIEDKVRKEPVSVGSDVWFGRGAIVLPGVSVGHGACIGAHSVVTRDVEPYEIVAGNPAKNIGWRFCEETRSTFLDLEWWEWEIAEITERVEELHEIATSQQQ